MRSLCCLFSVHITVGDDKTAPRPFPDIHCEDPPAVPAIHHLPLSPACNSSSPPPSLSPPPGPPAGLRREHHCRDHPRPHSPPSLPPRPPQAGASRPGSSWMPPTRPASCGLTGRWTPSLTTSPLQRGTGCTRSTGPCVSGPTGGEGALTSIPFYCSHMYVCARGRYMCVLPESGLRSHMEAGRTGQKGPAKL